jgi:F-type H+-transporting ATPase subunit alpha
VPVSDVLRFERELLDHLGRKTKILATLRDTNVLDDDTTAALEKEVDAFKETFQTGDGQSLAAPGKETFEATEVEDVNQEKIVKSKR